MQKLLEFCDVGWQDKTKRTFCAALATDIERLVECVGTEVCFEMPKAPSLLMNVRAFAIYWGDARI